jgi:hypothetical protein
MTALTGERYTHNVALPFCRVFSVGDYVSEAASMITEGRGDCGQVA